MKELKTPREVLQAWSAGNDVEILLDGEVGWIILEEVKAFQPTLDIPYTLHKRRIAQTKPSIDWSHVSEKYTCLARDKNGSCFIYENSPKLETKDWWPNGGDIKSASVFQSLDVGTCDWTESLVERPANEEKVK